MLLTITAASWRQTPFISFLRTFTEWFLQLQHSHTHETNSYNRNTKLMKAKAVYHFHKKKYFIKKFALQLHFNENFSKNKFSSQKTQSCWWWQPNPSTFTMNDDILRVLSLTLLFWTLFNFNRFPELDKTQNKTCPDSWSTVKFNYNNNPRPNCVNQQHNANVSNVNLIIN